MKKIIGSLAFTFIVYGSISHSFADEKKSKDSDFQGTITYAISIEGELDAQTKAQMPKEVNYMFKGKKLRMEQISPMQTVIVISDRDAMTTTMLLDLMGKKISITSSKEDLEKGMAEVPKPEVKYLEETKVIAGYTCKKAEVVQEGITTVIWYTDEIGVEEPNWLSQFKDIKGVLMEYSTDQEGIKSTFTVKEVKKTKLKDFLFSVPLGYEEMSSEEFRALIGG